MPQIWNIFTPCTVEIYQYALLQTRRRIGDAQLRMLQAQYAAPNRTVTAPQLARAVGYSSFSAVNLHYGRLGRLLSEVIGDVPHTQIDGRTVNWWAVLSFGIDDPTGFQWVMHSQLAEALEKLDWVAHGNFALPEEVSETSTFSEGAVTQVTVNAFERSHEARQACIAFYGATCFICNFNFAEVYGAIGDGFIHVHHERPLSEIGEAYRVDPVRDLKPVCPNCHAMLHRSTPAYSVEQLKQLIAAGHP